MYPSFDRKQYIMAVTRAVFLRVFGHITIAIILVIQAFSLKLCNWLVRQLVTAIKTLTGATIERDFIKFHVQREIVKPIYENNRPELGFIDEELTRKKSFFPISPEDLITKAKVNQI